MKKGVVWAAVIIVVLVVGAFATAWLFYPDSVNRPVEQSTQQAEPRLKVNPDNSINIPEDLRQEQIKVFHEQGYDAFRAKVEQDFRDSGLEFDITKHYVYLNLSETPADEVSQ